MPPLSDIGRMKLVSELFLLAIKVDPVISVDKNNEAIMCLMEYGYSERDSEKLMDDAYKKLERGIMRSDDQTLSSVSTSFRRRDHIYVLKHVQRILERGEINETVEAFFNKCVAVLYHEELIQE